MARQPFQIILGAIVTDAPKLEQSITTDAATLPVADPASSDISAKVARPAHPSADNASAEQMSSTRVDINVSTGDESKFKYIPESLDRFLKYRLLRVAVLIAIVAGVSIYVYEKFGRKEPPATINIYTHPTQEEADRNLKVNQSRFYYCLYGAKEEYRAQCMERELALWKQENGQPILPNGADVVPNDRTPPANEATRGVRRKQDRKVVNKEKPKKKSVIAGECSPTLLNPNPCGPTGGSGGNSSGSPGGAPAFR
jgi:hypothetical protein